MLWVFLYCFGLFTPLLMLLCGRSFLRNPPKQINGAYGYRTKMSRKNQDTWDFAHQYCGRLWMRIGWVMLILSLLLPLLLLGRSDDTIIIAICVLCSLQVVALAGSIYPVERALHRTFDQNGQRIN